MIILFMFHKLDNYKTTTYSVLYIMFGEIKPYIGEITGEIFKNKTTLFFMIF